MKSLLNFSLPIWKGFPRSIRMLDGNCQKALSSAIKPSEVMGGHHESKDRFVRVPENAEWAELYGKGGFHPVLLDDVIAHRYRVLRKLGKGRCSTVWLAKDDRSVHPAHDATPDRTIEHG